MLEHSPFSSTEPLTELSLEELSLRIASADPTPGGGSVSALVGSLGAALGCMVWRLTESKGTGRHDDSADLDSSHRLTRSIKELQSLSARLRANVDRDAQSYEGVLTAMRLPKATDADKAARRAAIEAATRVATEVPLETARLCLQVMEACLAASRQGHPGAITDAGVGLLTAFAGVNGALYNVQINLSGLSDEAYAAAVSTEVESLRGRAASTWRDADAHIRATLASQQ